MPAADPDAADFDPVPGAVEPPDDVVLLVVEVPVGVVPLDVLGGVLLFGALVVGVEVGVVGVVVEVGAVGVGWRRARAAARARARSAADIRLHAMWRAHARCRAEAWWGVPADAIDVTAGISADIASRLATTVKKKNLGCDRGEIERIMSRPYVGGNRLTPACPHDIDAHRCGV